MSTNAVDATEVDVEAVATTVIAKADVTIMKTEAAAETATADVDVTKK